MLLRSHEATALPSDNFKVFPEPLLLYMYGQTFNDHHGIFFFLVNLRIPDIFSLSKNLWFKKETWNACFILL